MNPLEQYPVIRQWAYRLFWIVGIILGAVQAFCLAVGADAPIWVGGALAVLAYVSIATNYTADRNVSPTTTAETNPEDRGFVDGGNVQSFADRHHRNERGYIEGNVVVTVAAIVVILAGLIYIVSAL